MSRKKRTFSTKARRPKLIIVGIFSPRAEIRDENRYFEEFLGLLNSLEMEYDETFFTRVRTVDKANFLTKGKLAELQEICEEGNFEQAVFSVILSPLQERNLEELIGCEIFDRERLILEIFKRSATSAEGKIQVEMAEVEFLKSRLAGKGIELGQQLGVIGTRGPGETIKEKIRRHLDERLRKAKSKLRKLESARSEQRKKRVERNITILSLVGYTNAGKSTILNKLTKSNQLVEDRLFATLDTTTRKLALGDKVVLLSDTVGFISELPHHLVEAFKSTLDELRYATLLIVVVDLSNPVWPDQVKVVMRTLDEISVKKPTVYVFNKADLLTDEELADQIELCREYSPHVIVSAKKKEELTELKLLLQTLTSSQRERKAVEEILED
jgi:GTP-binding protein HflX